MSQDEVAIKLMGLSTVKVCAREDDASLNRSHASPERSSLRVLENSLHCSILGGRGIGTQMALASRLYGRVQSSANATRIRRVSKVAP